MKARENPFRTSIVESLPYLFESGDLHQRLRRLKELHYRAALVGPHGVGKTTLLHALGDALEAQGLLVTRFRVFREERRLDWGEVQCAGGRGVVLLDGYDELSTVYRIKLWRAHSDFQGLLLTSHEGCFLPMLEECRSSPILLGRLLTMIIAIDLDEVMPLALYLHRLHKGNIRDVFAELYRMQSTGAGCLPPARGLHSLSTAAGYARAVAE